MAFSIDEASDLLLETGYRKPLQQLCLLDKGALRSALLDYHCVLKVKAEMDQFKEGLTSLGVLNAITTYPALMKCMFVDDRGTLTAGKLLYLHVYT